MIKLENLINKVSNPLRWILVLPIALATFTGSVVVLFFSTKLILAGVSEIAEYSLSYTYYTSFMTFVLALCAFTSSFLICYVTIRFAGVVTPSGKVSVALVATVLLLYFFTEFISEFDFNNPKYYYGDWIEIYTLIIGLLGTVVASLTFLKNRQNAVTDLKQEIPAGLRKTEQFLDNVPTMIRWILVFPIALLTFFGFLYIVGDVAITKTFARISVFIANNFGDHLIWPLLKIITAIKGFIVWFFAPYFTVRLSGITTPSGKFGVAIAVTSSCWIFSLMFFVLYDFDNPKYYTGNWIEIISFTLSIIGALLACLTFLPKRQTAKIPPNDETISR